jgi:hypothetical protein
MATRAHTKASRGLAASRRMVTMIAQARAMPKPAPGPLVQREAATLIDRREADDEEYRVLQLAPPARAFVETPRTVPAWRICWGDLPPSQNVLMRQYRNKHAYEALLKTWAEIFWAAMVQGQIPRATGRRRLEIVRCVREETYRLDRGNLAGGCKPVLDGAVRAGLLIDDREDYLDDHYRQAIDPRERVEILVHDL